MRNFSINTKQISASPKVLFLLIFLQLILAAKEIILNKNDNYHKMPMKRSFKHSKVQTINNLSS